MTENEKKVQTAIVESIIERAGEYKGDDADTWYRWLFQDLSRYLLPSMEPSKAKMLIYKLVEDARKESLSEEEGKER